MPSNLLPLQPFDLDRIALELRRDPRLKSDHTRRSYLADLQAFETWRAGRFLTRLLVEEYAAGLQAAGKSPNTINRALAAIRWYARRLADLVQEQPAFDETAQRQRAELAAQAERAAGVQDVRGSRRPRGRHIAPGELAALMSACENDLTPAGARDAALIALAWACGLRRDELAGLTLDDLSTSPFLLRNGFGQLSSSEHGNGTQEDNLSTPPSREDKGATGLSSDEAELLIRGKGDKERTAFIYNGAYSALAGWLALRGGSPGPLFCTINKAGSISPEKRLSGEALRLILEKRLTEAKVKPLTWHDFRRSFAGNLLDAGVDLATVQRLMGHSDPTTTSNYDRRGDETRRKAVRALFVPYRGRLL
jgi:site-specific recombinase XerD